MKGIINIVKTSTALKQKNQQLLYRYYTSDVNTKYMMEL